MANEKKRLIIIDSNSIIHRAFHALPPLSTKSGEVVGAIYGFLLVFLKAIREFQPDYIAATFDLPGPTFRHEKFKEYKATRPPTAEGICQQLPKVKEMLKAFGISVFEKQGFEADDIIATISDLAGKQKAILELETIILSGDSDTLQLVDKATKVYFLRKGVKDTVLYDENKVLEKYQGLTPEKLADFKALKGDPTDNIPGVKGIGEKTAIDLILKFNSLKNLFKEIEENSEKAKEIPPRIKEILIRDKEKAFLSKELSLSEKNVPIEFDLEKCFWRELDKEKAREIFEKFEFQSLINRLSEI
jgi:DNA polymerase-1